MTHSDDREDFEQHKERQSIELGKDSGLFGEAKELTLKLDRYDYSYLWSWMGVPVIQLPADIMATQEVIWQTKPDVIIETGVARGGSVLFMASLLEMMGNGKVIGIDIDIRAHNRESIENNPMSKRVTLIEGSSIDEDLVAKVRAEIPDGARVMVVLDSDHSRDHVLAECRAYGPMVTEGCYLVVADTLVGHLSEEEAPKKRSQIWYKGNEPLSALKDYMQETDRFEIDPVINGKLVLSSSPGGYLKCLQR
ncbi:cephalosporin hydroxylase family protein [Roseovarius sp. SCSIO 43702]|uniref:cephalosporin hydroxylase family protein n=1 Tax=Roseovarius sp. SCSIO 43702 TaxID=2823043 RepID=UPI001C73E059|nr:CmcI family methyltransferase [Roseovarius sp. SCSIO 43702]QYX55680.1 cephalosporin hydroxylase family protein [Roseovarius sp. SCSIO 43702]